MHSPTGSPTSVPAEVLRPYNVTSLFEGILDSSRTNVTACFRGESFLPDLNAPQRSELWWDFQSLRVLQTQLEQEQRIVKRVAAANVGSGLHIIALANLFPTVETILVADSRPHALASAYTNMTDNISPHIHITTASQDVCDVLRSKKMAADLILADLSFLSLEQAVEFLQKATLCLQNEGSVVAIFSSQLSLSDHRTVMNHGDFTCIQLCPEGRAETTTLTRLVRGQKKKKV